MRGAKKSITSTMFWYWILVIVWQYVRPVANRSLADTLVKIGLFGTVILYAMHNKDTRNTSNVTTAIALFEITQLITILSDSLTMGSAITVVFMFLELIVFLVWLRNEEIAEDDIEQFGILIIRTALVMAVYNMVYHRGRFLSFLGGGSAYGNECKSFLYSNHEFALYLTTAIIFTVWFNYIKRYSFVKCILIIAILGVNLFSTYSRTAIIGGIVAVTLLSFFAGSKSFMKILLAYGAIIGVAVGNARIRYLIFNQILKDSFANSGGLVDTGRSSMYTEEWLYYKSGSFWQKLFGHGYVGNQASGHDAYLYLLNLGGLLMFIFFVMVIVWSLKQSLICLRYDKSIGSLMIGLQVFALLYMIAQTPILFFSTMDSFFITVICVLIPLYLSNHLQRVAEEEYYIENSTD